MKKYRIFFISLSFIIFSCSVASSQGLIRQVVGSGGIPVQEKGVKVNSTIGQTHIGLLKSTPLNSTLGVGYWYNVSYLIGHPNPVTVVLVPFLSAEIGKRISIPLILQESKYFKFAETHNFEATIRYSTSVLQPVSAMPMCWGDNCVGGKCLGEECLIKITGSTNDSSGVLGNIDFIVRLGSIEKTPLIIESFRWIGSDSVRVLKRDGELEVLGICKEGDTVRTIKKTVAAALYTCTPNPASTETLINFNISEHANTKITLTNNLGRETAVLFEGIVAPGRHTLLADLADIPSGMYFVSLITPSERFTEKLLIKK